MARCVREILDHRNEPQEVQSAASNTRQGHPEEIRSYVAALHYEAIPATATQENYATHTQRSLYEATRAGTPVQLP